MVAQTRGQISPRKLKFQQKLGGRGQTTDALQKKLKTLHGELRDMDQEQVDVNSLSGVRKELIEDTVLMHKDTGVKAYAACCIADLLRLYAPDAPYTQRELERIFSFFFQQLALYLKGGDSPYYEEYFDLLESLSTVKSVVLVCDLPDADRLMNEAFRKLFTIVCHNPPKKIELFVADILIALIDECQSLPNGVLECLLSKFMVEDLRMENPEYRLSVQICNATADKLQRHVCQYFTEVVVEQSRAEQFDEVAKAHNLIKRLNRSCPALLHNVVPQLEEELRVAESQLRIMATQVLGEMFADKGGADFVRKYPTTWNAWLMRKNDKSAVVRLTFVEAVKGVLSNLSDQQETLEEVIQSKLFDPDEKVRAAVCKLYSQLDYETALHHVSAGMLRAVAGRGLDKKHVVRVEALTAVGRLYSLAYPEIENNDPAAITQFSWIPEAILHMAATTIEVKSIAEQIVADYIFPLPSPPSSSSSKSNGDVDEAAWTDRLLYVMTFLDEQAINALLSFSGMRGLTRPATERFVQACIDYNGGVIDEDEEKVTEHLKLSARRVAGTFPDPQKAMEDLHAFAKLNEGRLYKLLKTCMDTQVDLKSLVKSTNEFLRRMEQSSSSLVPTMTIFLRRASLRLVNQSSVPTLIKRVQKGDSADGVGSSQGDALAQNAQIWMNHIAKHGPAVYKSHVGELSKAIADEKNARLVEVCLQGLAAVSQFDKKLAPSDKRTLDRVMKFVMSSNARHAKFAARILAHCKDSEEACGTVVESIADVLPEAEPDLLAAHIVVLAQLALKAPDAFEQKSDVVTSFLIKKVLMKSQDENDEMDTEEEWVEDSAMTPLLRAKLYALKVCRNRCLAHASSETAVEIARPVLKMFVALLQHSGSLTADGHDNAKTKARLRLQAGISMLHLGTVEAFSNEITVNFILVAITIQDPCYQVRISFMDKLVGLMTARKLGPSYNVIPFLSVHDPEADVINRAKAYVTAALRSMPKAFRLQQFEIIFIRLLHLVAHHPDFAVNSETLPDLAKYFDFYLEQVANAENISLLYHLAMKAKTVRDAHSHQYSENLYAASEMAQHLIKARAKQHSWSLESYPGKVRLPGDILRPLPSAEAASQIIKTVYLPDETLAWLKEHHKTQPRAAQEPKQEKPRAERKTTGKRKAPVAKTNGAAKRTRTSAKRRKADESDEDEPSSSSPSDEEDEGSAERATEPADSEGEANGHESEEKEEKLSRGARTRAKIKQQAKKPTKRKARGHSPNKLLL
ncbi:armadillo-type protein [Fomitopsis serialis]|uniref:armadillo-type protein n=1 Tax=Fomitopsis serialis TaxID=139415 RepID=UPI002007CA5B|nr:armadillo-type protein [Neoantrodia serialis]KAH9932198.1 armadillo-type protein [Neoantrodia serialis]